MASADHRRAVSHAAPGVRPVKSVLHAIELLEVLADAGRPLGVSDLARRTGQSKAAVYNLLNTLEHRRLIAKDPDSSLYSLGWGLFELGAALLRDDPLARHARRELEPLALHVGETVLLGILDGYEVLYLDRAHSRRAIQMVATTGRRSPLHATATGKVLLAGQPDDFVDEYLSHPLKRHTPRTVTDADHLRRQLERIRHDDYATCIEEHEPALCSLSVPVRDYRGLTACGLTLAGPAHRFDIGAMHHALPPLQEAADRLSEHLGYAYQQPTGADDDDAR